RGKDVFHRDCFGCHNVPNVFNNRAYNDPSTDKIPGVGYDIGVAQANFLGLDFRYFNRETGLKEDVILPLQTQTGETVEVEITIDPGMGAITKRFEDLYVFKVPQLRNLEAQGRYMHDNSLSS